MVREGKFGVHEAVALLVTTSIVKIFYSNPAVVISKFGTASWYMSIVTATTALVGFTFIYFLLKRFPSKNIVEIYEISFGRFLGFIFSGVLCLFFLFNAGLSTREFTEALIIYVLPLTPPYFIVGFLSVITAIACIIGLESIARVSKIFFYILISGLVLVLLLSWKNYNFRYLTPIFGYGIDNMIVTAIVRSSAYGEVIIVAVVAKSLQGIEHIKRVGYLTIIIWGEVFATFILMAYTVTFPYTVASGIMSPMYTMTTLIDYGTFLQRMDPLFLFIWNISAVISVTMLFYTSVSIYCKMFRIQDMRPIVLSLIFIFFTIALIPKDSITVATGYVQKIREYGWIIFFGCPLLALIVSVFRRKGTGKAHA